MSGSPVVVVVVDVVVVVVDVVVVVVVAAVVVVVLAAVVVVVVDGSVTSLVEVGRVTVTDGVSVPSSSSPDDSRNSTRASTTMIRPSRPRAASAQLKPGGGGPRYTGGGSSTRSWTLCSSRTTREAGRTRVASDRGGGAGGGVGAGSWRGAAPWLGVPHWVQKRASSASRAPQLEQKGPEPPGSGRGVGRSSVMGHSCPIPATDAPSWP
jgi:hypothetical protein